MVLVVVLFMSDVMQTRLIAKVFFAVTLVCFWSLRA